MAELDPIAENPQLKRALKEGGIETETAEEAGPLYRVFKGSKIPVSKAAGALWQSRVDQAGCGRKDAESNWSEAIRYYEHDQSSHRSTEEGRSNSGRGARRLSSAEWSATENIVFSNAATMLPMLYAKNPSVEATAVNPEMNKEFARCCEKLINALFSMKEAPGINIKNKARRAILGAYLTNSWYLKIDWVKKDDSREEAYAEIEKLSVELKEAKTTRKIKEIEGKINALESKVDLLSPAGPTISLRSSFRIYVDPTSQEPDHSDANWMVEEDYIQTDLLNALYCKPGAGDELVSVYEPTHVVSASADSKSIQDEVNNFSLFSSDAEIKAGDYGYKTAAAFKKAQYTKVWYVWDKTTRRVLLFADNNWDWPLWVWDDPLKLLRFFPFYRLWFHETPDGAQPKGEVTYYLDQQDTINDINSTINQGRKWAKNNIFYDKNSIKQEDVEQVLKGPDGTARGVDIPEGKTLRDVIFSITPPAFSFPELLSTDSSMQAINRISGVSAAQQGEQFKTNTTNKAVDFYQSNIDIRVEDRIDAIEDWLGDIAWGLVQLAYQHWDMQTVSEIIGQSAAAGWQQGSDTKVLRSMLSVRILGGSTDKPTSKIKQERAIKLGEIVGQFASAAPATVIVMLKMFEQAFDDFSISEEDWAFIRESIEAQMANQGGTGANGAGPPQSQGGSAVPPDQAAEIEQLVQSLPPEAQAALEELIATGMPAEQALQEVMASTQPQQPTVQ